MIILVFKSTNFATVCMIVVVFLYLLVVVFLLVLILV